MDTVMLWFWKPIGEFLGAIAMALLVFVLYVAFIFAHAWWTDRKRTRAAKKAASAKARQARE